MTTTPLRVLLAEDDQVNQVVARHMLESLGHEVTVVADGHAAVAAATADAPDLVLMDVHMPRLDGVAATRRLMDELGSSRPPVIAMTANALPGDRERFLAAGMDDYVSKPIELADLRRAIERTSGRARPEPPAPADTDAGDPAGEAPGGQDAGGPIDRAAFVDLHGEDTAVRLLPRIAQTFLAGQVEPMQRLATAIEAGDGEGVRLAAHRLKGSAASLSAPRARDLARDLEELGRAGDLDAAPALLAALRAEVERIRDWSDHQG